jgi:hypothetical protein
VILTLPTAVGEAAVPVSTKVTPDPAPLAGHAGVTVDAVTPQTIDPEDIESPFEPSM